MSQLIDICCCDKAEVLRRLYNASRPMGLGRLLYVAEDMTHEGAAESALVGLAR